MTKLSSTSWMTFAAGAGLLFGLGACAPELYDPSPEAGRIAFIDDCSACHGLDGRGEGSFGASLIKQPPDLTTLSARFGGDYPRDYVMSIIDGYSRGEHFSKAMPEFGAGDMGPTVVIETESGVGTPVPVRLLALAAYLETIQREAE